MPVPLALIARSMLPAPAKMVYRLQIGNVCIKHSCRSAAATAHHAASMQLSEWSLLLMIILSLFREEPVTSDDHDEYDLLQLPDYSAKNMFLACEGGSAPPPPHIEGMTVEPTGAVHAWQWQWRREHCHQCHARSIAAVAHFLNLYILTCIYTL